MKLPNEIYKLVKKHFPKSEFVNENHNSKIIVYKKIESMLSNLGRFYFLGNIEKIYFIESYFITQFVTFDSPSTKEEIDYLINEVRKWVKDNPSKVEEYCLEKEIEFDSKNLEGFFVYIKPDSKNN